MPASTTGKTGKTKAVLQPEPRATSGNKSRKARVKEDVDPDYAEEAEDFFYGEGM
jgi:hypothetical protein